MAKSYAEKLRDPRWQRKRLEILERDGFQCAECGDGDSELHVHHKYYMSRKDPWDYPGLALVSLCKDCHKDVQERTDRLNLWLSCLGQLDVSILIGVCIARLTIDQHEPEAPLATKLLSYEECMGAALALSAKEPHVGTNPLTEYLANNSGTLDTGNPKVAAAVKKAWCR